MFCQCCVHSYFLPTSGHKSVTAALNEADAKPDSNVKRDFYLKIQICPPSCCVSRYWLCLYRDRVSTKHLLHCDLGLGTLLPVSVLSARAPLGKVQAALEHRALCRGHSAQEQDPLAGSQRYQLYLPRHRVLGVSGTHTPPHTSTLQYTKVTALLYLACVNVFEQRHSCKRSVYF